MNTSRVAFARPFLTAIVATVCLVNVVPNTCRVWAEGTEGQVAKEQGAAQQGAAFFEQEIRPVLVDRCFECHSVEANRAEGGLVMDNRKSLRRGGDQGPAIVPGSPGKSLLLAAIRHDGLEMPLDDEKLDKRTIANFVRWIDMGAPDPREGPALSLKTTANQDQAKEYWAFQLPRRVPPPEVKDAAWPINVIDRFVLWRLERNGLRPSSPADPLDLIRRIYFDLIGLPPSPREIDEFLSDDSPGAYPRLVDKLLDSEQYGEKWAQHWLDVIRFAESEGFEYDRHLPGAWRFRDYVIRSLNEDKPFDQFVREQISGDEMRPRTKERMIAAGFHRFGAVRRNAGNPEIALSRNEVLTERTDIIGSAFLGLTIGCARCHDHKIDPVSQEDYYSLQAFLAATREHNQSIAPPAEKARYDAMTKSLRTKIRELQKQIESAGEAELGELKKQIDRLNDQLPPTPAIATTIVNDQRKRTAIHVLKRGVWGNKGKQVRMRFPSVLSRDDAQTWSPSETNPKTKLADWLASPDNPLTSRVIANRVWQYHFGNGLVATPNDFGQSGQRPSHPELLDFLALYLQENDWRLKPLHRLIVLSNTYRQSSRIQPPARAREIDPDNRLLWRFSPRRLLAEELRDAMLAVSGRLNATMYGESIILPVEEELVALLYKPSQWRVTSDRDAHDRRSIYLIAKRNLRLPFMEAFDQPALQTSCPKRESSTHAPQALELLNGRISNDLARSFADRLTRQAGREPEAVVSRAWRLTTGRFPRDDEMRLAVEFLTRQPLREFALAMFNRNEFLYVP